MGNSFTAEDALPQRAAPPRVPASERFSVAYAGYVHVENSVAYDFLVSPPAQASAPGQVIRKRFHEFRPLEAVMAQRHGAAAGELPPGTLFKHTEEAFVLERAAGLEAYLEALLCLEPQPRTQALRRFLGISHPPGSMESLESRAPPLIVSSGSRLPIGVVGWILAFEDGPAALRSCSPVCRAMCAAARNPRCWPSLRFRTSRAERWSEPLFGLLTPTCSSLQSLVLDLTFEQQHLAVALPGGLLFPQLRRLALRLGDAEASRLGAELLECVESPKLQRVALESSALDEALLCALCSVLLGTTGGLTSLRLVWSPAPGTGPLRVSEDAALVLRQLMESAPGLQDLHLGAPDEIRGMGFPRLLMPLQPPYVEVPDTQPVLGDAAGLPHLRELHLDFLSDDALVAVRALADGSLQLRRARFTGVRRSLGDPDDALATLLPKLGQGLEEFSLLVEVEAELRSFMQGFIQTRMGALPELWQGRSRLRSLTLNWTAFDDDGVQCILENCPHLHTLLLDRSEYWTDAIIGVLCEGMQDLQHFRMRSSSMLSDHALEMLGEVAFRFVTLEVEPSYSHSSHALDQLKRKLSPDAPDEGFNASLGLSLPWPSQAGVAGAMAAAAGTAGEPDPFDEHAAAGPAGRAQALFRGPRRSSGQTLRLLKPQDSQECSMTDALEAVMKRRPLHISR